MNIVFQQCMRPEVPAAYGPVEYRIFCDKLKAMDHILEITNVEMEFLLNTIEHNPNRKHELPRLSKALRINILKTLLNESCRDLAMRIADSSLCQWFLNIRQIDSIKAPGKTFINDAEKIWSKDEVGEFIDKLNQAAADEMYANKALFSDDALDFSELFADTTCLKTNIHHPVDWLLFRDAVRTILKSIQCIRDHGIVYRITDPEELLSENNRLAIEMTMAGRNRVEGKKAQKKLFRKMKLFLIRIKEHGIRYSDLLKEKWEETDLSEKQRDQILDRLTNVLDQVDDAICVAETRIIKEKQVPNGEKILSLYEDDVQVIKRGKLGANIEFGNRFYLAEQRDGLIVDWDFFTSENKSDAKILEESVKRVKKSFDLKAYTTDRGFNSEKNSRFLSKEGVFDGTCPRSVPALKIKMADERFRALQKRRAQTEARIGIFKNVFTGEKILRKGTVNRTLKVAWSVLTHNLWVLARLAVANKQQRELQAAA